MKKRNLFGFLCKKEEPVKTPVKATVCGITAGEYSSIRIAIEGAYQAAAERQRPGAKEPSAYMKGLQTALELLKLHTPHDLEVQL